MILIALGGNLPGPAGSALDTCREAARALSRLPLLRLRAVSPFYATAPEGEGAKGPAYVNAVARFGARDALGRAGDPPAALLAALAALERAAGRIRTTRNAPRPLDLDIVTMGDVVRDGPDPVLPHPRAHLRRFVLGPIVEIAPDWRHPVLGADAASLLAGLGGETMRRLADGWSVD